MKIRALRGVCVGPGQHLLPGDCADVDTATAKWLMHIKAVEEVKDEPVKPEPVKPEPVKHESPADPKPVAPTVEDKSKPKKEK